MAPWKNRTSRYISFFRPSLNGVLFPMFGSFTEPFNLFYLRDAVSAVLAMVTCLAGWEGGWASVTHRYCIKTAKPIWQLFRPSESTIILVFWDPCADIHGGGKIGDFRSIFDGNRRLSRKRCEIGRWLLWNVNRKSWCRIGRYNFRWPWVTPNPGFKVTGYLQVEYLKNGAF